MLTHSNFNGRFDWTTHVLNPNYFTRFWQNKHSSLHKGLDRRFYHAAIPKTFLHTQGIDIDKICSHLTIFFHLTQSFGCNWKIFWQFKLNLFLTFDKLLYVQILEKTKILKVVLFCITSLQRLCFGMVLGNFIFIDRVPISFWLCSCFCFATEFDITAAMFNSLTAINFPLRESLREIHKRLLHVLYWVWEMELNNIMNNRMNITL